MKRLVIIPILVLLAAAAVFPQKDNTAKIKKIRDFYTSVSNEIEKIEKDEEAAFQSGLAVNELVVNKLNSSWPAVGNYLVVYRFYYERIGEEHYPNHLVKVSVRTEAAARRMYEELLFNESGKLVFFFEKTDTGDEHRLYFENEKLIQYAGPGDKSFAAARTVDVKKESERLTNLFKLSIGEITYRSVN